MVNEKNENCIVKKNLVKPKVEWKSFTSDCGTVGPNSMYPNVNNSLYQFTGQGNCNSNRIVIMERCLIYKAYLTIRCLNIVMKGIQGYVVDKLKIEQELSGYADKYVERIQEYYGVLVHPRQSGHISILVGHIIEGTTAIETDYNGLDKFYKMYNAKLPISEGQIKFVNVYDLYNHIHK